MEYLENYVIFCDILGHSDLTAVEKVCGCLQYGEYQILFFLGGRIRANSAFLNTEIDTKEVNSLPILFQQLTLCGKKLFLKADEWQRNS